MSNIWVKESYFEREPRNLFIGESGWYESFTDDKGELFRSCQKEFGGCTSKIYLDVAMGDGTYDTRDGIGWVFAKRMKYEDCDKTYIREVWCQISVVKPKNIAA